MTVAVSPYTATQRQDSLKWLARNWDTVDPATRDILLATCSHPFLQPEERADAMDSLRGSLALLDGLNHELWADWVTWEDVDPDIQGGGPDEKTEIARDIAHMRVDGDLDWLLNGAHWGSGR